MEIPLDSAYSDYVVNIQGLLQWSILGNTVVNGHWVETEVLVRVCDEVGDKYRFGHHGAYKDNEWAGIGNHYTTFFREYDSRIGRWLSPDPAMAKYPGWSPYVFNFNNPILINDPLGDDPPSIKATLIYGQKNSRTFSSLMRINSITGDNYGHFISFGNTTETYNQTGKIKLVKGEDIKWQVVQLAHELTNRSNLKQVQALDKKVSEGKVTPKQYAKQLAQAEVAGQINQVKVAAEIEYRYQGKEYDALNNVINKYANGELTDKDLQKMIITNDEHLGTYESQGMVLRKEYVQKEAKVKQIRNNANKDVGKQKSEAPTPFDISLPGYTR